ncbi:hypothetical protein D030_0632B, partial [Vibrio parahaemolyticus AQ3810]
AARLKCQLLLAGSNFTSGKPKWARAQW